MNKSEVDKVRGKRRTITSSYQRLHLDLGIKFVLPKAALRFGDHICARLVNV